MNMKYIILFLVIIFITGCSKNAPSSNEEEWDENNQEESIAEAPISIAKRTFTVNRQSFKVYFTNGSQCKITDDVSFVAGSSIIGTPTYQYKKESATKATLKVNYTTKMYVGSDYSTTTCDLYL